MDPAAETPQGAGPILDSLCVDAQRLLCSPALADPVAKVIDGENLLVEMMDPGPIPQQADPNPNVQCVKAKRLCCSPTPANPVSKVFDDNNTSSSPATPLGDEDLLCEILLHLPPNPSSLPRASLVCTLWHSILSDPKFLSCFRKHHQKPPLLGFFTGTPGRKHNFVPFLDMEPDRIPVERFAVPKGSSLYDNWDFLGCRHSLAVLISDRKYEVVVWDPLTGQQHRVPFPPGLRGANGNTCFNWHVAVLCADTEDGHVHGDWFLSPFKLALTCGGDIQASACLYESASGVWGNIVSAATASPIFTARPSVLTRSAVYWLLFSGDILALDIERQGLDVIEQPTDNHATDTWCFQLLQMEDGELGLAVLADLTIKLWEEIKLRWCCRMDSTENHSTGGDSSTESV